ncbi:apolipo protein O-domain-containing protein [Zopfochytrium polystomum]|nr:apolipo protein O-domain-containing protein [Zopfochytrium polystomum]
MPSQKPSIYDDAEDELVVVDQPTELELALRRTRHAVSAQFASTRAALQKTTDSWISFERRLRTFTGRYAVSNEPFLPGTLYVTLSLFAGSILAKNRSAVTRVLAPAAFTVAAFAYWYPETSRNLAVLSWRDAAQAGWVPEKVPGSDAVAGAVKAVGDGAGAVEGWVGDTVKKVREITGGGK